MDQIPTKQNPKGGFETIYFKEEKKISPEFIKSIIFDALNLITVGFFSYFSYKYLNNKAGIIPALLFGIFYFIIILFESALNKSIKKRLLIVFLESIIFFYFWFNFTNIYTILNLWIVFLMFRFWGEVQTFNNFQNYLQIKFNKLTYHNFSKSLIAIILVFTGFYIVNMNINNSESFLSQNFFNNFWNSLSYVFKKIYPEINIDGSLNDLSYSLAIYQIKYKSDFKNLLPDE
ncbi:MAG: hypothetical protein NZ484_00865, partial [Patescibacteria group bacterium]|nr:hypothetical protein [Patescibacteria group bacterium]MDW8279742.1 hypothetical protein [bacterium]